MPIFGAKSRAARGCASKLACGRRIDPATRNRKIVHAIGENAQRSVGADRVVRPWGNGKFAAAFRKNGCAACGESAASTPTNILRIRRGAFVFDGAHRRADRVVRPYGCIPFRIGAVKCAIFYRADGVEPHLYANLADFAVLRINGREGRCPSPWIFNMPASLPASS